MARGVNKAILVGNVGGDPDIKHTADGRCIANFSLATSESWTDKNSGQKQEHTEWHRCKAFGRLAEIIEKYVKKGDQLYIEGKIKTRSWEDKDGNKKYTTEVEARDMQMLGSASGEAPARAAAPARRPAEPNPFDDPDIDDDIPF